MSSAWRWLCNALWSFVVAVTTLSFATTPSFSQAQEVKPETVAVRAVAVVRQQVTRTTTQPATIEPYYQAEIRSRLAEYVLEVKVDIGDVVRKDDVLATLDIPEMSKQAEIIQARIRRLRAEE
ncbi:MAG: hypothetical protein KDA91_11340, partial [Planctomycetaceae bacterium]|nr:hypothetical protein [Planctomycetaceae bacterium]